MSTGRQLFANGKRPEKLGQAHRGSSPPTRCFQTSDGWLTIGGAAEFLPQALRLIGKPELADDARFKTNAERVKNNDLIVGLLQAEVLKRSTDEWMVALEAEGMHRPGRCCITTRSLPIRQILARGMVAEVVHTGLVGRRPWACRSRCRRHKAGVRRAAGAQPAMARSRKSQRRPRGRSTVAVAAIA